MGETQKQSELQTIDMRVEQARELKLRIVTSCVFVEMVIFYIFAMLYAGEYHANAVLWLLIASSMVAVTYLYSKAMAPGGITRQNVNRFLFGHVILSSLTGAVWGMLAMYFVDWNSAFSIFIASSIVCTVVVGGIMPGTTYRPGFIGLSTFMLIPFGLYVLLSASGAFRLAGFGVLLLYVYGMASNLQAQRNSKDGIFARKLQALNAKIQAQNQTIQRVNEEKTRFLAATSHDFSQPLHAQGYFIQSLGKLLKEKDQIEILNKIETSWRHQKRLLEGLVEINRLDSGTIVPKPRMIDLKTRMRDLANEFDETAAAKSIEFTTKFDKVTVFTDPLLLTRLVQNLLSNAMRYTPNDGKVAFSVLAEDGLVKIAVTDNGPGIPEGKHEDIFDEYVQLHETPAGEEVGLGLGLSIVKRLRELLDLELDLRSVPDKGTEFVLTLPVYTKQAWKQVDSSKPVLEQPGDAPLIVLVDDQEAIRQSMSELLSDWGYRVISASAAIDTMHLVSHADENPALLIVDKRLADGKSGIELIREIREEVNEETPALLMSGDLDAAKHDTSVPIDRFLGKPIEPDEILRIIAETLAKHKKTADSPGA